MRSTWSVIVLCLCLSACAVQQTGPGRTQMQLDQAELFGQRLESIRLADGSEATLRMLGRTISLKIESSSRVIPFRDAEQVKVLRSEFIGDRTLIVFEKSTRGCPQNVDVLSVRGRDVSVWEFRQCRIQLQIEREGDEVYFDQVENNRLTRTIYRDDKLLKLRPVRLSDERRPPSGAPATTDSNAVRSPPRDTRATRPPRPRNAPAPIVAEGAPRHMPELPITTEQFAARIDSRSVLPEPQLVEAPVNAAAAKVNDNTVNRREAAEPGRRSVEASKSAAAPQRPRGLPGEVEEAMAPIRIKLD